MGDQKCCLFARSSSQKKWDVVGEGRVGAEKKGLSEYVVVEEVAF
jgi:hypothetical protein